MAADLDNVMEEALRLGTEAVAIACADVHAGFVIGASARDEQELDVATDAAMACVSAGADKDAPTSSWGEDPGALIVSSRWVHAYARVATRPELVVVGVGRSDANVALLLDWVRRVAGGLGAERQAAS